MKKITPNLMVDSMADACSFYLDILGFRIVMSVPVQSEPESTQACSYQWVLLQRGSVDIMLQVRGSLEQEYPRLKNRALQFSGTFYISCNDIVALYNHIEHTSPLCISKPLHVTWYDAHEFAITDTNGYLLVFVQA